MSWRRGITLLALLVTSCSSISTFPKPERTPIEKTTLPSRIADYSGQSVQTPEITIITPETTRTQISYSSNEKDRAIFERTPVIPSQVPAPGGIPQVEFSIDDIRNLESLNTVNVTRITKIGEIKFEPWEMVTALRWSPDGKILAASVGDELLIYQTGKLTPAAVHKIGSLTSSLDFSVDGSWLAAGSKDGKVRIFEVKNFFQNGTGEFPLLLELPAHKKGVNSLDFSKTMVEMLATGGNDAVARFWNARSGANLGMMIGGTFSVPGIAFSPDGKSLAVINGTDLRIRQVGTESILGSFLSDSPLFSIAYSPDGNILAAGDLNNQILIWDPHQAFRSGSEQYPQPDVLIGHDSNPDSPQSLIWNLAFNPAGNLLASVGGDGTLRIWDVARIKLLTTCFGHPGGATSLDFHPDGNLLVSGGLDGTIKFWGISQ